MIFTSNVTWMIYTQLLSYYLMLIIEILSNIYFGLTKILLYISLCITIQFSETFESKQGQSC
ncbi:hypothetical protein Patl1_27114 [Pistacia atlantica]|uniref:Uncharacterized protein n=1 Tax=Pistacia atlantica TaxID=434234 RepID=A0ACC1B4R7_9ROSI|nr:hypothetical protein Patl1_27114 [Pistacia atlantica]